MIQVFRALHSYTSIYEQLYVMHLNITSRLWNGSDLISMGHLLFAFQVKIMKFSFRGYIITIRRYCLTSIGGLFSIIKEVTSLVELGWKLSWWKLSQGPCNQKALWISLCEAYIFKDLYLIGLNYLNHINYLKHLFVWLSWFNGLFQSAARLLTSHIYWTFYNRHVSGVPS